MITVIENKPGNVAAFRAAGAVTKEDFETVVMPVVNEIIQRTGELNYLMEIDTELKNFSAGAWMQDALLGLKKLTKWHRAAIVTDSQGIKTFTDIFNIVAPGEFKAFDKKDLDAALQWTAGK
jgi:hypothetical protein